MTYEDRYKEFEQYLTFVEPGQKEKVDAWQTAIACQVRVDKDFALSAKYSVRI